MAGPADGLALFERWIDRLASGLVGREISARNAPVKVVTTKTHTHTRLNLVYIFHSTFPVSAVGVNWIACGFHKIRAGWPASQRASSSRQRTQNCDPSLARRRRRRQFKGNLVYTCWRLVVPICVSNDLVPATTAKTTPKQRRLRDAIGELSGRTQNTE